MTPRTRAVRYGASIGVALLGVACGALIPGTAGGTAATVLVGLGLVGVVSLIFYEIGLTADRDRAADASRQEPGAERRTLASPRGHETGRPRGPERRRGQRRRLR